ncbi:MAG: tail protein X [Rickettsia endosymbiont of Ixodes persulcatus]|nr:tail protein X [Rickettsia endosymbiont of Ixodes persulcatus]
MANYYYTTNKDETLDAICWRHYVRNALLGEEDPFNTPLLNNFLNTFPAEDSGINGIIEKVLEANPGISHYLHLPPGLMITLPDIKELPVDLDSQDLWD